jgi:hypothetical protein
VGPADGRVLQGIEPPPGSFAAGAGTEVWIMHYVIPLDFFQIAFMFISIKINIQDFLLSMTHSGLLTRIL